MSNPTRIFRKALLGTAAQILAATVFFSPASVHAQRQLLLDPVDQSNLWISSLNPAMVPYRLTELTAGIEIFHLNFVPGKSMGLRENRLNLNVPFWLPYDLGLGVDLRSFTASIYSEFEMNLLLGRKITGPLSLGLKLGMENRSFDSGQFNLVDLNDPLLTSGSMNRTTFNLGAGLYLRRGQLSLGVSLTHLNQPNIARDGESVLPREIAVGVGYKFRLFEPALVWNDDGYYKTLGLHVSANVTQLAAVRVGIERGGPIRLEGLFNLSRDSKLSYAVNLPTPTVGQVSRGTHQLTYNHVLGREPDIGPPLLSISSEVMNILEERVRRVADKGLSLATLESLPGLSAAFVDPDRRTGEVILTPLLGLREALPGISLVAPFRKIGQSVVELAQQNPSHDLAITVPPEHPEDARLFGRILRQEYDLAQTRIRVGRQRRSRDANLEQFTPGRVTAERRAPRPAPETAIFSITVPGRRRLVKAWSLSIASAGANVVRKFSGTGELPRTIRWDWRDDGGSFLEPGRYVCSLEVLPRNGRPAYHSVVSFDVTLTHRQVTLRFSQKRKSPPRETTGNDKVRSQGEVGMK